MNAAIELKEFLEINNLSPSDIVCADIKLITPIEDSSYHLRKNYNKDELEVFLYGLHNLNYNEEYGIQYLYGTIWLTRHRWLERREYDGSEWWELRQYPTIPEKLK